MGSKQILAEFYVSSFKVTHWRLWVSNLSITRGGVGFYIKYESPLLQAYNIEI